MYENTIQKISSIIYHLGSLTIPSLRIKFVSDSLENQPYDNYFIWSSIFFFFCYCCCYLFFINFTWFVWIFLAYYKFSFKSLWQKWKNKRWTIDFWKGNGYNISLDVLIFLLQILCINQCLQNCSLLSLYWKRI